MSLVCRPQREDFFPRTKRGHGSAHDPTFMLRDNKGKFVSREINPKHQQTPCIDNTCQLNAPKSSNLHTDQRQNIREWCDEHGLSIRSKDRPNGKYGTPAHAMIESTGGRY